MLSTNAPTRIPVSKKRHKILTKAGFIHVTGLMVIGMDDQHIYRRIGRIGGGIGEKDRGTYAVTRDRVSVIITLDRQVWLGRNGIRNSTVISLTPNGDNPEISFKWRPFFHQRDLLCRLVDPNWAPDDLPYREPTAQDADKVLADLPC